MRTADFSEDTEDPGHSLAERASAAARSTWLSVAVNLALTTVQIAAGILAKSQVRPPDMLRMYHERIELWILNEAGVEFSSPGDSRSRLSGTSPVAFAKPGASIGGPHAT